MSGKVFFCTFNFSFRFLFFFPVVCVPHNVHSSKKKSIFFYLYVIRLVLKESSGSVVKKKGGVTFFAISSPTLIHNPLLRCTNFKRIFCIKSSLFFMDFTVRCGTEEVSCEFNGEPRLAGLKSVVASSVAAVGFVPGVFDLHLVVEDVVLCEENVAMLSAGCVVEVRACPKHAARTQLRNNGVVLDDKDPTDALQTASSARDHATLLLLLTAFPEHHHKPLWERSIIDSLTPSFLNALFDISYALSRWMWFRLLRTNGFQNWVSEALLSRQQPLGNVISAMIQFAYSGHGVIHSALERMVKEGVVDERDGPELFAYLLSFHNIVVANVVGAEAHNRRTEDLFGNISKIFISAGLQPAETLFATLTRPLLQHTLASLVKSGCNINFLPNSDAFSDPSFLRNIAGLGFDFNCPNSIVADSCLNEDFVRIKGLLEAGVSFDVKVGEEGEEEALIIRLAQLKKWGVVEALEGWGGQFNVNAIGQNGRTATMEAARCGAVRGTEALLALQPELEVQDPQGWVALTYAAFSRRVSVVSLLLSQGALVDGGGYTALRISVERRCLDICTLLLSHNADRSQSCGDTPCIELAEEMGDDVVALFEEKGGVEVGEEEEEGCVCRECGAVSSVAGRRLTKAGLKQHVARKHNMKWSFYMSLHGAEVPAEGWNV